jgi:hypothetical protein
MPKHYKPPKVPTSTCLPKVAGSYKMSFKARIGKIKADYRRIIEEKCIKKWNEDKKELAKQLRASGKWDGELSDDEVIFWHSYWITQALKNDTDNTAIQSLTLMIQDYNPSEP